MSDLLQLMFLAYTNNNYGYRAYYLSGQEWSKHHHRLVLPAFVTGTKAGEGAGNEASMHGKIQ